MNHFKLILLFLTLFSGIGTATAASPATNPLFSVSPSGLEISGHEGLNITSTKEERDRVLPLAFAPEFQGKGKSDKNNKAPKAEAGKNQKIVDEDGDGEETVYLDGSESSDRDGSIVSYSWSIEGNGEELATGVNPVVVLPLGRNVIILTVTDDGGLTDTDKVRITIEEKKGQGKGNDDDDEDDDGDDENDDDDDDDDGDDDDGDDDDNEDDDDDNSDDDNEDDDDDDKSDDDNENDDDDDDENVEDEGEAENMAPVAHAGDNQELSADDHNGLGTAVLDGSKSEDQDGSIVSYSWSIEGSGTILASGVNPVVSLPIGSSTIVLTVTDDGGLIATDRVTISILEATEEEEEDPAEDSGEEADGNDEEEGQDQDTDQDGAEGEEGEGENENEDTGGEEDNNGEQEGGDGNEEVNDQEEEEEEQEPEYIAPQAHAGEDQELRDTDRDGREAVSLDGSQSTDPDGRIVSYSWRIEGQETALARGVDPVVELPIGHTTILLTVTDNDGLTASDTVVISIIEPGADGGEAFLPNLFSPNGDQMNDRFILHCSNVDKLHWRIYNRQGRLVYETRDLEEATQRGWDGNAFGSPQPAGSYIWILEGSYLDGTALSVNGKIKGSVTLIR